MKRIIFLASVISASLLLGGCSQQAITQVQSPKSSPVSTIPGKAAKPTATPVGRAEDPEVKAVTNELNSIDSAKDFPAYSTKDIQ